MSIFKLFTPVSYWLLIILWSIIFAFYINRLTQKKINSKLFNTLLVILAIDAFRTLFESVYFGFWYTSLIGFLPKEIHSFLTLPQYVIIPKALNVLAAILVILIVLRHWVPEEEAERKREKNHLDSLEKEIKKRNKIQQLLVEHETQLLEAQNIAKIGYYVLNIASGKWTSSAVLDNIFGIDGEFNKDIEGWKQIIHPDYREDLSLYLDNHVLGEHRQFNKEYKVINQFTHKELWVHGRGNLKFDSNGTLVEMLGTIQDINDEKLADKALRDQKRLMQMAIDNIPHYFFWKDRELVYQGCNKNFAKAAGVDNPADIIGKTDYDLAWKKEEAEFFRSCDQRVLQSLRPELNIIEPQLQADGKQAWLDTNKVPILDENNNILGILGAFEDVTERLAAEKHLQDLTEKLKAAQQLGKSGWWEYDIINDKIVWPEETCFLYGVNPAQELEYETLMQLIKPEYRDYHNTQLEQMYQTGAANFAYPIIRPDGRERWIWVKGEVAYDDRDQPIRLFGTLQDMTDQKHVEEALVSAKVQAEAANRSKSVFLSNMSHELRTPLNAILGYTQLFATDSSLSAKQQNGVSTIHQAAEHLLLIINDILDMSKVEAGKLELVKNEVMLKPFFKAIYDLFQYRSCGKDIEFRFEVEESVPSVIVVDELRFRQVIFNLLSNAFKFTSQGYCLLKIRSKLLNEDSCALTISVEDSGVGIDKNKQKEVFKPFQQGNNRLHHSSGSGLGLAISKQLVELMGGQITLVSPVNQTPKEGDGLGSRFSFSITTDIVHQEQTVTQQSTIVTGFQFMEEQAGQMNILVVDDKQSNRAVLCDTLEPLGFEVTAIESGATVIKECTRRKPDLILMDLRMPDCDGFTALTQLRAFDQFKDIPVIAITASTSDPGELIGRCLKHGFNGFTQKPFIVSDLLQSIEKLLPINLTYQKFSKNEDEPRPEYQPPPDTVITNLAKLLAYGDISRISKLADDICIMDDCYYKEFGAKLQKAANDYDFSELEKLISTSHQKES